MTVDLQAVRVIDLIEAGLISKSEKLHGYHGQGHIEARIKKDGTIICGETTSSSPSVAAGRAITSKFGNRSPGRNYLSVNGWLFWQVIRPNGEAKTLADLRNEFFEAQQRIPDKI